MRAVIQRVNDAEVKVADTRVAKIEKGLLILLGIKKSDNDKDIRYVVDKVKNLRIFEDNKGDFDASILDIEGSLLIVSQFTLYGKCDKGRRPDFNEAAKADEAKVLYKKTVQAFRETGLKVEEGQFQAYMEVSLKNDGPVTLIIDSPHK